MIKILVSECLYGGEPVRFDGQDKSLSDPVFLKWKEEGRLIPVCPEILGGLGVPREESQRLGDRVVTKTGKDVTRPFTTGAEKALDIAREQGAAFAVLRQNSPSCGSTIIYDGTFSGVKIKGRGVAAECLEEAGLRVFGEDRIAEAEAYLLELEEKEHI